ncbi:universal stress protein [Nocardioides marmoribigeumensis]|uniref:Nucleotide-binding universal stress UspA family protein n=1 Tax=Nocardioides marmoribigeumensis TaxID=433649 RepID=A0ABU2BYB9_9ACTN|nr:universal stress protein [Nocardioides marmoribigeumensis]MDR7363387.1 nucleotide-binding universal stress UspA family protein [Nocardioides marmoribigeumensis]
MTSAHGIVVGVTGKGQDTAALRWAGERAARTGERVTLAHAYGHVLPPPPPSVLVADEPLAEAASYLLHGCVEAYLHVAPEGVDKPEAVLDDGRPGQMLVDLSRDADLVVVSHRDRSHRIHTGSTTTAVATHAHCPVVAVPEGWSPDHTGEWVTVGVHEGGAPQQVLETAAAEASSTGAPLRLVHGWHLDSVYDDLISARIDPEWDTRLEHDLLAAARPVLEQHPGLPIEVQALHEWPADALSRLAATSRLLVVGRHTHHTPLPHRLGSVARTAIRTSTCPVLVVPVG